MKVVTHNIIHTLGHEGTKIAVRRALSTHPQMVGFQEIGKEQDGVLKQFGTFVENNTMHTDPHSKKDYLICRGHSEVLPVLLRKRYVSRIHTMQTVTVAPRTRGVRSTPGTMVIFTNRFDRTISILNTHPTAHHDNPANKEAFMKASEYCDKFVRESRAHGYTPFIVMDGNGLNDVRGLIPCWDGNKKLPTGPGGFTIDMVFAEKQADDVHTFASPSDHDGVVATYENFR